MNQLDQDEKLIIEVQQYLALYDQNSYDYRDLRKKERMWQDVAESLGLHAKECQARWRVLRDKFVREMRKNVNPKRAGTSALQVYQGSWPLMSQLMFLTSHVKHKPNRPNKKETFSDTGGTDDEDDLEASDEDEPEIKPDACSYLITNSSDLPDSPTPPTLKRIKFDTTEPLKRIKFDTTEPINIGDSEMEILRLVTNVYHSKQEDEENEERLFCLSLVPSLKRLPLEKRSLAKLKIQRILHSMEFPDLKFEL